MNGISRSSPLIIYFFLIVTALVFSGLILTSVYMAVVFCLAIVMVILLYDSPDKLLMILLFIFPFNGTVLLKDNLVPIPGFKPLQLLAIVVLVVALCNLRKAVKVPVFAIFFFGAVIMVFSISIAHSLVYLKDINSFLTDPLSPSRYFLSKYCKPLIFLFPAIILTKFIYREKDFDKIGWTIDWSITILSVFILYLYLRNHEIIISSNSLRDFLHVSFGTHTNNIANYYIIGFPFVLARFFQRKSLAGYIKISLAGIGIALLFSRSAYFLFILSFFIYSFISKRIKIVPVIIGLLMVAILFFIPETIIQRATKGFYTSDNNVLFAGRIDGLWRPLLNEYSTDYKALLIGKGRYAILSTKVHKMGITIQSEHPHNMYLEMLMDAGIIGLTIFISLFFILLNKCFLYLKLLNNRHVYEYFVAVITSLICFLISGCTDRTFFPDEINGYLWIIVAFAIILSRYANYRDIFEGSYGSNYQSSSLKKNPQKKGSPYGY